jgi:cytochrome c oxidase assembly protein subunit 15
MPFDVSEFPAGAEMEDRNRRWVAGWLFTLCAMVLGMIVLGGATRLTGSGLSIMEWAPLLGALPPLGETEWQRLFHLYQQIPQYRLLHDGFGIDGFKQIFWLEWTHRLWGRLIGLVFIVPLLVLWARGAIAPWLRRRLVVLFLLLGAQGAVGWFMVSSGFFPDATAVSPYRLVVHLAVALVLYVALLWTGLSVLWPVAAPLPARGPRRLAWFAATLLALTILAGGFVAGTHAGLIYNTFPLMDGALVPPDYAALPFPRDLTENVAAVQFDHRLLATATAIASTLAVGAGMGAGATGRLRWSLLALFAVVTAQYALGVATLLAVVPVSLATLHQATAVLALTAMVGVLHAYRPAPRLIAPKPAASFL